jgi:hypothetical protein
MTQAQRVWEGFAADPRVTVRRTGLPASDGTAVVYWMQRAQRANDNPAVETAIGVADEFSKPVAVYFALMAGATGANLRHYRFMVEGGRSGHECTGRGVFAETLRQAFPHLPLEEEGRLCDPRLRENFVERVFAYHRLRGLFRERWTLGLVVAFHTAHKLQLLAHSPRLYAELGAWWRAQRPWDDRSCAPPTRRCS